jgi:leader peptidase (prepilin peptidase) / N-methyltransferase
MEAMGFFPPSRWVGFIYHAVLFSFLMVASVCDLKSREIPLQLTLTGTLLGLVGAVLLPWPWPYSPAAAGPLPLAGQSAAFAWQAGGPIEQGIYPWPVWGPLPAALAPGGNWQTGLATGLVGALVGTFLLRSVGFLFGTGLGKEALGLGDADLMMLAGAFLGWQVVVVAFFLSVVPALFFGIALLIARNDHSLPFGPSLSLGILGTMLGWRWIAAYPGVRVVFFWGAFLLGLVVAGAVFLFLISFALRLLKGAPAPTP